MVNKIFKYFIVYKYAQKIRHLCIFRPKMSIYERDFDKTKGMYFLIKVYFLIKDETFLLKYNEIWEKVSSIIKKEFNSEPVHNKLFQDEFFYFLFI